MNETLFKQLNAPFPYEDYEYNKDDDRVYIKAQAVKERLNQVLGVGFWYYRPVEGSIKTEDTGRTTSAGNKVIKLVLLVELGFYNKELKEWVKIIDAGSQDMNRKMEEGDAIKSSNADGLKKCASAIGLASDLYKGLIAGAKDARHPKGGYPVLPDSYKPYYEKQGWEWPKRASQGNGKPAPVQANRSPNKAPTAEPKVGPNDAGFAAEVDKKTGKDPKNIESYKDEMGNILCSFCELPMPEDEALYCLDKHKCKPLCRKKGCQDKYKNDPKYKF